MFYISSPEPEEKLEKVNLLLLGKNEVPVFYATVSLYPYIHLLACMYIHACTRIHECMHTHAHM